MHGPRAAAGAATGPGVLALVCGRDLTDFVLGYVCVPLSKTASNNRSGHTQRQPSRYIFGSLEIACPSSNIVSSAHIRNSLRSSSTILPSRHTSFQARSERSCARLERVSKRETRKPLATYLHNTNKYRVHDTLLLLLPHKGLPTKSTSSRVSNTQSRDIHSHTTPSTHSHTTNTLIKTCALYCLLFFLSPHHSSSLSALPTSTLFHRTLSANKYSRKHFYCKKI